MSSSTEICDSAPGCEFTRNLEIVRQIDMFASLPFEQLKVFAYLFVRESFQPEDPLFKQGDDDGQAFYLLEGSARLVQTVRDETRVVHHYDAGAFVGRLALVGKMNRLYSLVARTRIRCLMIDREKFIQALNSFPQSYPLIMQVITNKLIQWERQWQRRGQEDHPIMPVGVSMI